MRTIAWPTSAEQPVAIHKGCGRARQVPSTIRPCDRHTLTVPDVDNAVEAMRHVAAWSLIGGTMWAALILAGRAVLIAAHLA